jgi:L-fucono-1,5-lactonase
VRPMMQDIPDTDWMLRSTLDPVFRTLVDLDLRFDALVRPRHLGNLRKLLDRHPALKLVIDHGAKPRIAAGEREPWGSEMRTLARETAAWCKLSGFVTEAGATWRVADLRPYADHLLESFGPERLIWGSDWPVVELAGGYERWWEATSELLRPLDQASRERVLGGNALRFYGIATIS